MCTRVPRRMAGLLAGLAIGLLAVWPSAAAPEGRVFDQAGLLAADEVTALETAIADTQAQTGYDLVVVTADDTGDKTPHAYADDYFDDHGFGTGTQLSGAILLIDMQHRQAVISAFGGAADCMPNARIERALDAVTPYLSDADYPGAARAFLAQVAAYAAAGVPDGEPAVGGTPVQPDSPPRPVGLSWSDLPVALFGGAFVGLIALLVVYFRYRKRGAKGYQYPYQQKARVRPTQNQDVFLHKRVTTRTIPRNDDHTSSGSRGGGGSSHSSSGGGRSHSSGSRGF